MAETLSIDAAGLREQLERARAQRDELDRLIAWLEHGVELMDGLGEGAAVERGGSRGAGRATSRAASADDGRGQRWSAGDLGAPAEPRRAPPAPTGRDKEAKVMSVLLHANQPVSLDHIADQSGLTKAWAQKLVQALVKDGRIIAEGKTVKRRYRPADRDFHTEVRAKSEASAKRNADAEATRLAGVVLRDRVMRAVAADPGRLTVADMAEALGATAADVEAACAWLVDKGRVHTASDGTYRRNGTIEMAA